MKIFNESYSMPLNLKISRFQSPVENKKKSIKLTYMYLYYNLFGYHFMSFKTMKWDKTEAWK